MHGLRIGREDEAGQYASRVDELLLGRDAYRPSATEYERISFDEGPRRFCGSVECVGGWAKPWRNKKRPVFEGRWGCSGRCVLEMVRAAVRREAGGRRAMQSTEPHRHRVPLGLVMLAQGWITHPQLQAALQAQRENGRGRIGDWLVQVCGVAAEQVTRGLSVQWNCPVFSVDGFSARDMALVMPLRFVEEFGAIPLRVAGGRMLYLGGEDRLNASLAYAVEQMSGLRVESGLVEDEALRGARARLFVADAVPAREEAVVDEDAMSGRITALLEQRQPLASCLVRMHQYYWLRLWLESGTRGSAGNLPRSTEDMQDFVFTVGARA